MNYQLLEFDTTLFGFEVAKILPSSLSFKELQTLLDILRTQNVKLVYWLADSNDPSSNQAALELNGFLGSEHKTYLINLETLNPIPITTTEIISYQDSIPTLELQQLAAAAGTYSHFNTDNKFPKDLITKLYNKWIENSVNNTIAFQVLTIQQDNKIIAMATLGVKNNRGDIGLLAVNPAYHGQNFGTKLVQTAQAIFLSHGYTYAQVVTQQANTPACCLYEKCGFLSEKIENFYHFWL